MYALNSCMGEQTVDHANLILIHPQPSSGNIMIEVWNSQSYRNKALVIYIIGDRLIYIDIILNFLTETSTSVFNNACSQKVARC